jgi:hypothetical protein
MQDQKKRKDGSVKKDGRKEVSKKEGRKDGRTEGQRGKDGKK